MYKYNFILYWLLLDIFTIFLLYKYYRFIKKNYKQLIRFNIKFIILLILLISILILFIYITRNHKQRNNIRNNNLFNFNSSPSSESEFINIIKNNKNNKNINILGSCWGSFLNKKSLSNGVYINNLNKKTNETVDTVTYQCGALITDIQNELIKKNKTLCEFPSLEWITVGGWLSPGCHGHPGSIYKQLYKTCKIYDAINDKIFIVNFKNSFNYFGYKRYIILEVEFIKYSDIVVKNDSFILNNIDDCKKWLSKNTYGRLIFCGKRGSIGTIWYINNDTQQLNTNSNNVDKYNSKLYDQWLILDIESWISSNIIDIDINKTIKKLKNKFNYQTLSRSNQTVPGFIPEFSCIPLALNIYNFEVFTNIDCTPEFLNKLLNGLQDFHYNYGGRTEIRLREPNILMIDWSLQTYEKIKLSFNFMYFIGIEYVYIHKGKYIVENMSPCKLLDYNKLFNY